MKKPRIKMIILGVLLGLVLIGLLPVVFQNKMIYFPYRYDAAMGPPAEDPPQGWTAYSTADGRRQWGYRIEPAGEAPAPWPRFYLVFGGNASTAMGIAGFFEDLARRTGCGFFLVDYRGYGFNDGSPNEKGIVADALGAYDSMVKEGEFKRGAGVIGISLGGGAAFALAEQRRVDRLITLSTFTSMDAMARRAVPWPIYLCCRNHFPNDRRLAELLSREEDRRPAQIVLFHGRRDEVIPFSMGEALASTPGDGLKFIVAGQATHNDVLDYAMPDLVALLKSDARERKPPTLTAP